MTYKSNVRFNKAFSYVVLALALVLLLFAIWMFAEVNNEPVYFFFGIGLILGAGIMIWGALKTISESKEQAGIESQASKQLEALMSSQNQKLEGFQFGDENVEAFAHWKFAKHDWAKAVAVFEKRNEISERLVALGIFLVGVIAALLGAEWGAILAGLFAALLYLWLRTRLHSKMYKAQGEEVEVLITNRFIMFNSHFEHFDKGGRFLDDVEIVNHPNIGKYLLLTIAWRTGKGFKNSMDIRIPVSAKKENELDVLVGKLNEKMNNNSK